MPSPLNMDNCKHYGTFMRNLDRPAAEAMYWCFFVAVLCALFAISWRYGRVMERIEHMKVGDWQRQRLIHRCFYISLFFGFSSLLITILEAFVLLTLQFCDDEPLASLYWSTWTVLQVGAVVAIFGITLHVRHMIKGTRHPPWALALGTPVLVVAGLGHYLQGKLKSKARSIKSRSRSRSRMPRGRTREEPLSEVPTVRNNSTDSANGAPEIEEDTPTIYGDSSDKFNARIIGYTKEGDVILRISPELTRDLNSRVKIQSGITWDEPRPRTSISKLRDDAKTSEPGTPRVGRSRHRSSSSVTFKGRETEPTIEHIGNAKDKNSIVNDTSTDIVDLDEAAEVKEHVDPWKDDVEKGLDVRLAGVADSLMNLAEDGGPKEGAPREHGQV